MAVARDPPEERFEFVRGDEATGRPPEYLQVVNRHRLWWLARRYWFDAVLIVGVGLGIAESTVRQNDHGGPQGPLWFDVLAILATVLPLFARRRFPFAAPVAVGVAIALSSFVDENFVHMLVPPIAGLAAVFAFLFIVMWKRPEWNTLAALGPRPDGGGRFYGVTNQVETLLLSPALVLGALTGPALPAVALLIAAGIAASSVGADGGGLVVYLAGFLVLALRLGTRPGLARVAAATAIAAAAALALVGIDAATGGSSHVTHAVGGGPGSLTGDLGHRLQLSWASIGSTWNAALLFALGLAALVWLALRRPRLPILDALLVALAVSLIVNDTPTDVAGLGGLSALVLWAWWRSGERFRGLD